MNIIERISNKGSDKEQIAKEVIRSPQYIPQLLEGLNHDKGSIKFGCEKIFKKYYSPITGKSMITAGNIIGNLWKIALAKPELVEKITQEILKTEKAKYENKGQLSPECNNVVCGHAIDSLGKFYGKIKAKKSVIDFIKRQLNNSRKPVVKKTERFLKKYKIGI